MTEVSIFKLLERDSMLGRVRAFKNITKIVYENFLVKIAKKIKLNI